MPIYTRSNKFILIFGMPRSGTTWLAKIYDSHPNTIYCHEPDSWEVLRNIPLVVPIDEVEQYRKELQIYADHIVNMRSVKVAGKLPLFPKSYYTPLRYQLQRFVVAIAKIGTRWLRECSVPDLARYPSNEDFPVIWKSIESVGRLGVIVRALEQCRAVLIVRHPCGHVASKLRGQALHKFEWSSEDFPMLEMLLRTEQAQKRGLTMKILRSMNAIERLVLPWLLLNEKTMDDLDNHDGSMTVRYEDLCANPESTSRSLFEFANLPWNAQTEKFVRQSTSAESTKYYSVYKDPLKAANKWQHELSAKEIDAVYRVVESSRPGRLFLENE